MDRANIIRCWSATEGARDALRPNRKSMACSGPIRQSAATIKLTTTRTYIVPAANQARAYTSERNCDFIDTNRTCPIKASGLYGAFIVKGASRHFGRPLHSILLFDPRREHSSRPHISIAVARSGSQGRRFFSAAEGLSLTDASTAAGCRRSGGWPRDDPRGACHWPRSIARTTLVFG